MECSPCRALCNAVGGSGKAGVTHGSRIVEMRVVTPWMVVAKLQDRVESGRPMRSIPGTVCSPRLSIPYAAASRVRPRKVSRRVGHLVWYVSEGRTKNQLGKVAVPRMLS